LVLNVEVPVRVFDGNTFIDNLTIDDFELYEDSEFQDIVAVYLVKKKSVERKEERKRFAPKTSRSFYLWFEMSEYMPKLGETIDYFFKHVFFPGDSLAFKRAIEASEQYYLLYYMPKNYRKDGKFKKIKVRVKNKKFSVSHRAGYFAN